MILYFLKLALTLTLSANAIIGNFDKATLELVICIFINQNNDSQC